MEKLCFRLILTEAQRKACNQYLHNTDDYCWIDDTENTYDNIIDFSIMCEHVLSYIRENGWDVHKTGLYRSPDCMTLDLTSITKSY